MPKTRCVSIWRCVAPAWRWKQWKPSRRGPSSCPSFSFRQAFDQSLVCASVRHAFLSRGVWISFGCSNKHLQNRTASQQAFMSHSWVCKTVWFCWAWLDLASDCVLGSGLLLMLGPRLKEQGLLECVLLAKHRSTGVWVETCSASQSFCSVVAPCPFCPQPMGQ